ncbi:hypothetical protein DFR29_13316 [Tahibacter aquaticus]|uniref:Yip1-like protein n=1 Tax=Tahibacter aquaticus TaxID=520092 RepID=A0A4R6YH90_9GAMM|nr:hypothetical protein [Tahibacter aquaticus]TDR35829.1 hypothetical protein DFR29_13316 [Tahibacter aquaticus]
MDFLKILKSFEEFVYEASTWLVLLPRTLLQILLFPSRMSDYAAGQLASQSHTRFSEALSPPLLLILCILIAHFVDLGLRNPAPVADGSLAKAVLASEQNLLLYRAIAFGVWSLAGAVYLLVRTGQPVDRESLRTPFYEQCYLVSPFALIVSVAVTLIALREPWALLSASAAMLLSVGWFWLAQAAWMRRRARLNVWRSLAAATVVLVVGSLINASVGHVLTGAANSRASVAASADPA